MGYCFFSIVANNATCGNESCLVVCSKETIGCASYG